MNKHENAPEEGWFAKTITGGCLASLIVATAYVAWPTVNHTYDRLLNHDPAEQPAPERHDLLRPSMAQQIKAGHPEFAHMSQPQLDPENSTFTFTIPSRGSMPAQNCQGQYIDDGMQAEPLNVSCQWGVDLAQ